MEDILIGIDTCDKYLSCMCIMSYDNKTHMITILDFKKVKQPNYSFLKEINKLKERFNCKVINFLTWKYYLGVYFV